MYILRPRVIKSAGEPKLIKKTIASWVPSNSSTGDPVGFHYGSQCAEGHIGTAKPQFYQALASRNGGDVFSSDSYPAGTPGDAATPTRYSYHCVGRIAVAAGQWFNADFHEWESPHNPRVIALAFPQIFKVRHDPV
jgi:hypothetical protein